MKISQFCQIIMLSIGLISPSFIASFNPTINIPKIKFPETIKVKPDLSDLGKELGDAGKQTAHGIAIGAMEGMAEATESPEFGKAIGNMTKAIFRQTTNELANAIEDKEFQDNIDRTTTAFAKTGGKALKNASRKSAQEYTKAISDKDLRDDIRKSAKESTKTMGIGAEEFSIGLNSEVFPHLEKAFRDFFTSFINVKNAIRFGTPLALSIALPITGYYGTRVFWNVLEKRLMSPKPKILLPGSKYGRWDRIRRWRAGYKSPAMIFDQQVKDRLMEIQEKTKNIRDHIYYGKKTTYDNLLLYGEPGTGKTLFAQILADETNMDFLPVTAASLLQSGVEGIKYFDELLDMANRSKYGVIIFVDEADALFVNRDALNPESDHYKVLNHILALTGTGSNKFMLVAATNHAYVMDQAMGRRFQDRVLMPLPSITTRKELLDLYSEQVLFNTKENNKEFVEQAERLLTPAVINTIAKQTNGLSHAEIKDMIVAMHKKASATKTGMIIAVHIQKAIAEAIEKKQALEEDKKQLEQHAQKNKLTPAINS